MRGQHLSGQYEMSEAVDRIQMAQGSDQWRTLVNTTYHY
jgi:hypothetical protein